MSFLNFIGFPGEVLGFESLVHSVFEFVHTLCDRSGFRSTVKGSIDQIIYYIVVYMQITDDQVMICVEIQVFC